MSQPANNAQVTRWCFTYNNYDLTTDYKAYLRSTDFKIRRCVWGKEIAPQTGTRHLQGYAEFWRTVRLAHVRKIFSLAHWERSTGTSLQNYRYCIKEGDFEVFGDFSKEERGEAIQIGQGRPPVIPLLIRGLLNPEYELQTKICKEYADKHQYFDRITSIIRDLREKHALYTTWTSKLLFGWQYKVLQRVLLQDNRKILWITDVTGNHGKTFLCMYMNICYNFQYLDGVISVRDLASLLDCSIQGAVFDVGRAAVQNFDYAALESLKNGVLVSGKYRGSLKRFSSMKVLVCSNHYPNHLMLSQDRWEQLTLGEGALSNLDKTPTISPSTRFPFVKPKALPDLADDFDTREYLIGRVPDIMDNEVTEPPIIPARHHTSQVAGPSVSPPPVSSVDATVSVSPLPPVASVEAREHPVRARPLVIHDDPVVRSTPETTVADLVRRRQMKVTCKCKRQQPNDVRYKKGCPCMRKTITEDLPNRLRSEPAADNQPEQEPVSSRTDPSVVDPIHADSSPRDVIADEQQSSQIIIHEVSQPGEIMTAEHQPSQIPERQLSPESTGIELDHAGEIPSGQRQMNRSGTSQKRKGSLSLLTRKMRRPELSIVIDSSDISDDDFVYPPTRMG